MGLIEQVLGGRLTGMSADLMWEASGGNALFVRHLVEGALEAGTLRQVRGVWQLRGGTAVTSELASLLDDRIERLPEEEHMYCDCWPSPNRWHWTRCRNWRTLTSSRVPNAAG